MSLPGGASRLERGLGLLRSLAVYRGIPWRAAQLRRFYARFVPPGGLAFDIGAHAGNRVAAFRALGARVVAVEPQPDFARLLAREFGRDGQVQVLPLALGREPGHAQLLASVRTPTVSTLSADFVARAGASEGFRGVRWAPGPVVEVSTLSALIERHGRPDFVKIDVEGYELEVLGGLDQALPALSFEYLPAVRDVALGCIDRLESLGRYRYAVSIGEQLRLLQPQGLEASAMRQWLLGLGPGAPSGDVHAWRDEGSEGVNNESGVAEQTVQAGPIKAQSAAVARATASICNAEWGRLGGMSGHERFLHIFSAATPVLG